MIGAIQDLGRMATSFVYHLGRLASFAVHTADCAWGRPYRIRRLMNEMYNVGVLSLAVVCVSGLAVGAVLGLQGYNTLVRFGAEESLGAVVGLTLIRELGPVLTGLLVTGRAGSAIAAELASMVVTEQLDGLRMMSIDPVDFVVVPKALAMVLAMPLLSALFTVLAIGGGWLIGVLLLGGDPGSYLTSLESAVIFSDDVVGSILKALVFGILVALISTYRGFTAEPNAAGVSAAATSTVVVGSVTILIFDFFITSLWGV